MVPIIRQIVIGLSVSSLAVLVSSHASDAKTSISNIVLPEFCGFELITYDSPGRHPIASQLIQECDGSDCGIYVGADGRTDSKVSTWQALSPFIAFNLLDDKAIVQRDDFAVLRKAVRADLEGLRANVSQGIAETPFPVRLSGPDSSTLELVGTSIEVSHVLIEQNDYVAIDASGTSLYRRADGSIERNDFAVVFGFVHARDKILLTMFVDPQNNLIWSRETFRTFVAELVSLNR